MKNTLTEFVNLSFTDTNMKNKLTNLCGNRLLQNDFENTLCEIRAGCPPRFWCPPTCDDARRVVGTLFVADRLYTASSSFLDPVHPSFRALSGCLQLTVRRHKFNTDSLLQAEKIRLTLRSQGVEVGGNGIMVGTTELFQGATLETTQV